MDEAKAGSFIVEEDGTMRPNLDDEAMRSRSTVDKPKGRPSKKSEEE